MALAFVLQLVPLSPLTRVARLALWGCGALLIAGAVGCGEDVANPIVRLAESPDGPLGSGGESDGDAGDLCAPCGSRSDCKVTESCIQLTRGGDRFCSRECGGGNSRCPQGYVCSDVPNTPMSGFECVPEVGDCTRVVF